MRALRVAKCSRCGGNKRGWCNFIDEGGGVATDAVAYLAVGDVLTVQLCSILKTKIKDAKTINFYLFEHNTSRGFS